jgi:hypothetical protein
MSSQEKDAKSQSTTNRVTRVLLIAGAQRSGSTLLDRVIGAQEGFCSVGELHRIWEGSYEQNHLCGCGLPFNDCPFWNDVSKKAFGADTIKFDQTEAVRLKNSVSRIRYVPMLAASHGTKNYMRALEDYSTLLKRLYPAIHDVSGARVIVDSSKSPAHGLIISRLANLEVHVVHLVRDPRAVAFSWTRQRRNPETHWKTENLPIEHAWSSASRWLAQNAPVGLLSSGVASYCRLRYEDFLTDPDGALSTIFAPYEWVQPKSVTIENMDMVFEPTHTISGNPMRFKQGQLKLQLDDEWCNAMPWTDRTIVTAITGLLLRRYGYPLGSSKSQG